MSISTKAEKGDNKIKDYLANERTMLAWLRTGLTIFTLGCALARFGGSTTSEISLRNPNSEKKPIISGLILAICGVICLSYGLWRFFRTYRHIRNEKFTGFNIIGPILSTIAIMLALIAVIIIFFII